ncbi:hypothetical protein DIPPA_06161 [Diplonema papillatum]|nr:hypothetical protein DIPPA_06161 [Diplonema papillatum]
MVPCARCGKAFAESNQPKILRCGHTFCESCCEKGVQVGEKGKSNVLTCFECQAETPVLKKGDGVRELTTNWALIQTARDPPPPSRPADDPTQRPASHALEVTPAAEAKIREIETALTNMLKNEPIDFMRTAEEMHENLYWYSDPNRLQRVGHDPEIISLLMLFSGLLLRTSTGELPPAVRAVLLDDLLRLQFHRSEVVHQLCQNLMATFWDESTTAAALQREAGQQATADNPLAAAEAQSIALGARDAGLSSLAAAAPAARARDAGARRAAAAGAAGHGGAPAARRGRLPAGPEAPRARRADPRTAEPAAAPGAVAPRAPQQPRAAEGAFHAATFEPLPSTRLIPQIQICRRQLEAILR